MWVRVESRSRVGRYYWKRTDASASQWSTPPARELLDATASCNGALAAAPRVLLARRAAGSTRQARAARALDKLCRDPRVATRRRRLLSVDDLRQCAMRFAARCARREPEALSPNSAKKHSSVLRHVVLEDDFLRRAQEAVPAAPYRRSHTLAALDALGPEPTRLGVATLEAHAGKDDALAFAVYNAERLKRSCATRAQRRAPSSAPCCPCRRRSAASPSRLGLDDAIKMPRADRAASRPP
ncbi:hypothetical protein JL722_8122 [Aureococcus anophagefferens]|nr:hypothetical protein JL722_8122 [Aureococcus anophagefferens]